MVSEGCCPDLSLVRAVSSGFGGPRQRLSPAWDRSEDRRDNGIMRRIGEGGWGRGWRRGGRDEPYEGTQGGMLRALTDGAGRLAEQTFGSGAAEGEAREGSVRGCKRGGER